MAAWGAANQGSRSPHLRRCGSLVLQHRANAEVSTRAWLRELSMVLLEPPAVELLRVAATTAQTEEQAA